MRAREKRKPRALRRWVRRSLLILAIAYAAACLLPYAFPPRLSDAAPAWTQERVTEQNVNRATLITAGHDALETRLRLIANATESIRAGSYIYALDESGTKVTAALLAAAERGVKVRLVIDGLIGAFNLRGEPGILALGAHPNVEIRFYNPVNVLRPDRLNARYHEKFFVVDDQWLLLGGRNVSDEFLSQEGNPRYNYDLDALLHCEKPGARDAVALMTEYFDGVWNSETCVRQYQSVPAHRAKAVAQAKSKLEAEWRALLASGLPAVNPQTELEEVESAELLVNPTVAGVKSPTLWKRLIGLMSAAKERLWIQTPYLVMDSAMQKDLQSLAGLPADVKLMLNSRAAGNNVIASADYTFHSGMVKELGYPIYEFQGEYSMHTKAVLIDKEISVIGSFNFDMRSAYIDTELMLVIRGQKINALLEKSMRPMFEQSLRALPQGGYEGSETVAPKPMGFWKELTITVLSPFVSLLRHLV